MIKQLYCGSCGEKQTLEEWGESGEFWWHCHSCDRDDVLAFEGPGTSEDKGTSEQPMSQAETIREFLTSRGYKFALIEGKDHSGLPEILVLLLGARLTRAERIKIELIMAKHAQ